MSSAESHTQHAKGLLKNSAEYINFNSVEDLIRKHAYSNILKILQPRKNIFR